MLITLSDTMKIGIIISQTDPETVWNAFRLGNFSLDKSHTVKVFLIGKGVEYEEIEHEKFNVKEQVEKFLDNKGEIFACGSCIKSRKKEGSPVCPLSTMQDLMTIVEESDKIVSF
jgi:sulfur relay (sulfurtransferase) complex TusBCD TusD component (DsrE family)